MMCYELKNIAIFTIKGVDYRCILRNTTYDEAFNLLNNSKLGERVHYKWNLIQTNQLLKQLKKVLLEEHTLEISIQVLKKVVQ